MKNIELSDLRHFDRQAIDSLRRLREFNYSETYTGPSVWVRFWMWVWHHLRPLFRVASGHGGAIGYALLALALIGLVYLIFRARGIDLVRVFTGKPADAPVPFSEATENIHEIDFDEEIRRAGSAGNYRMAVRLLYLDCLKALNDRRLVNWQPGKTNRNYIDEIADPARRAAFNDLTRQFEYAWYGDFAVDQPRYSRISDTFSDFKRQLR